MVKKWYRSRRNHVLLLLFVIVTCIVYYITLSGSLLERNLDLTRSLLITDTPAQNSISASVSVSAPHTTSSTAYNLSNRASINEYIETKLQEALKEDKGTGCQIPHLDPFAKELLQFDKQLPPVVCEGQDWVKCYLHECRVVNSILSTVNDIKCSYQDIIYLSDAKYTLGASVTVKGGGIYALRASDHVKVTCTGKLTSNEDTKWMGYAIGYRISTNAPRAGGGPVDVLIFGFDSTSKNGFIRKMPKSYKYITQKLNLTILNGYNIVGDGTPAALFPILTGKTELELPDVRKVMNKGTLDNFPFIFGKLKKLGYHTAYFEDMPAVGTFQYRFNGFQHQPADHYLRAFYLEEARGKWYPHKPGPYCVGDTPRYQLMMNITEQFLKLPGSHFGFTFIADITHDNFNMISTADGATVRFLEALNNAGHLDNTLLFIMGDHGSRFAYVRNTLQGKLEERLPLMAIHVPRALTDTRPDIVENLALNADALTTPHDIHATILDALDMKQDINPYRLKGADLNRALSLFDPVPRNRSCSEAGIEPHWCACLTWQNVSQYSALYRHATDEFLHYINALTEPVRDKCEPRTLRTISWVMVQQANPRLLTFKEAKDQDGYIGKFNAHTKKTKDYYQIKVTVGPGHGIYEASASYDLTQEKFIFDSREISRINAYNDEPSCISKTHPHLNMYCYCKDHL